MIVFYFLFTFAWPMQGVIPELKEGGTGVQIHCRLWESNVIDTETFCAQINERNWFSYLYVTRIDSLILVEFAALGWWGRKFFKKDF